MEERYWGEEEAKRLRKKWNVFFGFDIALFVIKERIIGIIIGAVLTLVVLFALVYMLKAQKKKEKMRLYRKVSAGWGVVFE